MPNKARKSPSKSASARASQRAARTAHDLAVIGRDHIIPFRPNIFGITDRDGSESSIRVFDAEKHPGVGDLVCILWADRSRRPEFGYFAAIEYRHRKPRRVQLIRGGAQTPEAIGKWHVLGADDVLAREVGTFRPRRRAGYEPPKEGWPELYAAARSTNRLERSKEDWERAKVFQIPNPANSPWPDWHQLFIDPLAPLGPEDWVAAIEPGATAKQCKYHLGKVANLKRTFEMADVVGGKRLKLGGPRQLYHGVVIGMSRSL